MCKTCLILMFYKPSFMNFYRGFKWYFYSENLLTECAGHFYHPIFSMPCFQVSINSQVSLNTLNDSQSAGYAILNQIKLNQSKHCKHLISDQNKLNSMGIATALPYGHAVASHCDMKFKCSMDGHKGCTQGSQQFFCQTAQKYLQAAKLQPGGTQRQISQPAQAATFVLTGGGIRRLPASTENPANL